MAHALKQGMAFCSFCLKLLLSGSPAECLPIVANLPQGIVCHARISEHRVNEHLTPPFRVDSMAKRISAHCLRSANVLQVHARMHAHEQGAKRKRLTNSQEVRKALFVCSRIAILSLSQPVVISKGLLALSLLFYSLRVSTMHSSGRTLSRPFSFT